MNVHVEISGAGVLLVLICRCSNHFTGETEEKIGFAGEQTGKYLFQWNRGQFDWYSAELRGQNCRRNSLGRLNLSSGRNSS